jgi:hypothetical protein
MRRRPALKRMGSLCLFNRDLYLFTGFQVDIVPALIGQSILTEQNLFLMFPIQTDCFSTGFGHLHVD